MLRRSAGFTRKPGRKWSVIAAAKVGGIHANNTRLAEFIFQNLQIQNNLIHGAWQAGAKKLLFLGSSCIFPKHAPQPMKEDSLLTGPLEPTNQWYAVAKIAQASKCARPIAGNTAADFNLGHADQHVWPNDKIA